MKNRNIFFAAALMTLTTFAVPFHAEEAAQTEAAAEEIMEIGEDLSGQNYGFLLTNETGKEIKGVSIRINYEEFAENLLTEDASIADGDQVRLYCTPGQMVNYVPAVYDLRLTFADDTEGVLHTLPMGDAKEITLLTDEETGVSYVRFKSLSLNYEMDTLRREKEISEIGEAVLVADYKAKQTYTGGGYSGGGSGSGSGGNSSGGQTGGDGCLTDGILF